MADYGLLGGLAEGLKQGLLGYQAGQKARSDREKDLADIQARAEEIKEKKATRKLGLLNAGMKEDEFGNPVVDENSFVTKKRNAEIQDLEIKRQMEAADKGLIKTPTGYDLSPLESRRREAEIRSKKAQSLEGKTLPATNVEALGTADFAIKALDDALNISKSNPDMFGRYSGLMGSAAKFTGVGDTATKAAQIDADLKAKAQVIGKYLEGGKLATSDIDRYIEMLPGRGDNPDVVRYKVENLQKMIADKQNSDLAAFKTAGYDVGRFAQAQAKAPTGLVAPQITPADQQALEWLKANQNNPKASAVAEKLKAKGLI